MDNEVLVKLSKDLKAASTTMTRNQARYLLGYYITSQNNRKAADQKAGKMEERCEGEAHDVLDWASENFNLLEKQILSALNAYAESQPMGQWVLAIPGFGPIIASGLLCYVDLDPWVCANPKANAKRKPKEQCRENNPCSENCKRIPIHTAGHIWAFMGYDPSKKWEKGQKRPFCAGLKQIGYYAGECIVRCVNSPYRKLYDERKAYEHAKNDQGEYAKQAAEIAKARPTHAQIKTYKAGKLPDGHIHSRAKRYAVKQFISDWFAEAYRQKWQKEPPLPYPIAILGHAHLRQAH